MTVKTTTTFDIDINGQLAERGILSACTFTGKWERVGTRWRYPIIDLDGSTIAYRTKRAVDSNAPKYLWYPAKPDNPMVQWYFMPDIRHAIKEAGGVVYLANGEPSLMAFVAASVSNVIATTLSEVAVPDNVIPVLKQLGVIMLINIADSDEAGVRAARNWQEALKGSGIEYKAKEWHKRLGKGADANDLWIECGFDSAAFRRELDKCRTLKIYAPPPKAKPKIEHVDYGDTYESDFDYERALENLRLQVAERLGIDKFNNKGWSAKPISSPFREDKQPSWGYNIHSGVGHDFATDDTQSLYELAQFYGLPYPHKGKSGKSRKQAKPLDLDAIPEDIETPKHKTPPQPTIDIQPASPNDILQYNIAMYECGMYQSWLQQDELPIGLYSAVLVLCNARSITPAVMGKMHHALRDGTINWAAFTVQDVAAAISIQEKTVRSALHELSEWGLIHFLDIYIKDNTAYPESGFNSGRPSTYYTIETNYVIVTAAITDMLKIYYMEKHHKATLAIPDYALSSLLGIHDRVTYKELARKIEGLQDKESKSAAYALHKEFAGDGRFWQGWHKILQIHDFVPLIDWQGISNTKDLRIQLLQWWVVHVRDTNTQDDLQRLLGCSSSTVANIRNEADLTSEQRFVTVEYRREGSKIIPRVVSGFYEGIERNLKRTAGASWNYDELLKTTCQALRGYPIRSWVQHSGRYAQNGKLESLPVNPTDTADRQYTDKERCVMFSFQLSLPSVYRPMTADEIIERDNEAMNEADNAPTSAAPKAKATPRTHSSYGHIWNKHTPKFMRKQLELLTEALGYQLNVRRAGYQLMQDEVIIETLPTAAALVKHLLTL